MLSVGLRLGVIFFLIFLFIPVSFSTFEFVANITLKNSIGTYKKFDDLRFITKVNQYIYAVDKGYARVFKIINDSVDKVYLSAKTSGSSLGDVAYYQDYLYVADSNILWKVASDGSSATEFHIIGNVGSIKDVVFYDNKIYLLDDAYSRVHVAMLSGEIILTFSAPGIFDSQIKNPSAIAVHNDLVYVADTGNKRITVFDKNGNFIRTFGRKQPGLLENPVSIEVTDDYIFVADVVLQKILVYNATSYNLLAELTHPGDNRTIFFWPVDIHVDEKDKLIYVVDNGRNVISIFSYDIPPEKIEETIAEGDSEKSREALEKARDVYLQLNELLQVAKELSISFDSKAKVLLQNAEELHNSKKYSMSIEYSLESVVKAADEKMQLKALIREELDARRKLLYQRKNALVENSTRTGLKISLSSYQSCEAAFLSALNEEKYTFAFQVYKNCTYLIERDEKSYTGLYQEKKNLLTQQISELNLLMSELKNTAETYNYEVSLAFLESLLKEYNRAIEEERFALAEGLLVSIRTEVSQIREDFAFEDSRRTSVINQIKEISEKIRDVSKDYPDVYEKRLPEFTSLMTYARKDPQGALAKTQALVEEITKELELRRDTSRKTEMVVIVTVSLVALGVLALYLFTKK